MVPILGGFLWAVEAGGKYFYIYVEIFIIALVIIMLIIYPHFIAPLFNKFTELEDGTLLQKIHELANKLNFPLKKNLHCGWIKEIKSFKCLFLWFGKQ